MIQVQSPTNESVNRTSGRLSQGHVVQNRIDQILKNLSRIELPPKSTSSATCGTSSP